ncbi:hypothetical protein GOP47_0025693 [Adiantum capillus-veneris]|uniref:Bidirectional sugar transporter SWEET n=1 Tax=Adiantum capillus-veneris TaxID=13818 RepID=A0A9D4U0S7_ADICA|nr:hypothetical protein GOP47_0025693 [Adiantum capillus-veneris]
MMHLNMDPKLVLGILGNATAMALFLSPTPTFVRIFKTKSTEEFSGLPYVCTLLNCLLWVLYGLPIVKPHSMLIITINVFGVAMELFFITLYVVFATKKSKIKVTRYMTLVVIFYVAIIVITIFALHTLSLRQLVVGSVCVVIAVAMYAAPLSIMGLVIRTKSVEFMPFTLSLCNFTNSAVWTAYSLVTKDIFVGIPNGIGCISGIVQLILYALYYKNSKKIKSEEEKLGKGQGKSDATYLQKSNTALSKDLEKSISMDTFHKGKG